MVSISAQPPSCGEERAQIAQGSPRRQQKMVRHLRSLHHGRELADAILLRDHACFRTDAWPRMRPRGPPQGLGGTRYRTMSRQSEMVTSVRMSATIMAQRSDFADQRSFRVTAS